MVATARLLEPIIEQRVHVAGVKWTFIGDRELVPDMSQVKLNPVAFGCCVNPVNVANAVRRGQCRDRAAGDCERGAIHLFPPVREASAPDDAGDAAAFLDHAGETRRI